MSIPENGWRFPPLLIKDVAKVAGEPRETIRTREKQGVYGFEENYGIPKAKGWKRYTDLETIIIAVHAHLKRAVRDDDFADVGSKIAGATLIQEWVENPDGVPYFSMETFQRDRFMFFWRDAQGAWSASLDDVPDAAQALNNSLIDTSYNETPVFVCVNFGTIMKKIIMAMLEVQIDLARENGEAE